MTDPNFIAESTVTDRYQTTVPDAVRKALGLSKREKIRYTIRPNGEVVLSRADEDDPVLDAFLDFIARDIEKNPQHLMTLTPELVARMKELTEGVEIDMDAPLDPADD